VPIETTIQYFIMILNYLSKSKYMRGINCPRLLWYEINQPELIPPVDAATQARFDMGHEVGDLAKQLYPDGIEIPWGNGYKQAVRETEEAIKRRVPLFEATFLYQSPSGPLLSRADLLIPAGEDQWDMIEVKSSNSLKDEHVEDVAFQLRVMSGAGINVRQAYLMHLNPDYRRSGEIDPAELFIQEDLTDEVEPFIGEVDVRVAHLFSVLSNPKPPDIDLINECGNYSGCDLSSVCWNWLPEQHVGELYRGKNKALDLIAQGIHSLSEIPADYSLSYRQDLQRAAAQTGQPQIDSAEVTAFLDKLKYPTYAMDFETIMTALPLFDGMGPWQQLPFQYSVHVQQEPGGRLKHNSYLADLKGGARDPRLEFMDRLQQCLGNTGTILVYNASFETRILRETATALPQYQAWVEENVLPRILDLLNLFRSFAYYHPDQGGSCSLKYVVPALLGSGYEDMEIADGGTASSKFLRISLGDVDASETAKVRQDLLDYCAKDTESLFAIIEQLRALT
jgi:CRISPR/Cas system-associated exonuclease Cas4 (RecB family)